MSRIVSILRKSIDAQRLYNLAVQDDESYVANGIVVHNCKSYLVPNLKGSGKKIDPTGIKPSDPALEKYITLSEISSGSFTLAYIEVSKKKAMTTDEAKLLAQEITNIADKQIVEGEFSYRINITDVLLVETGTLKSFEPMEGVSVFYGRGKSI
jgi:hypothetical protein